MQEIRFEGRTATIEHDDGVAEARELDIGCGTGQNSEKSAAGGASRIVGEDLTPQRFDVSRS